MANTRELRRRIKSIKNTSQITKAMQMVAATKMRRAQNQALSGRPYSQTLNNSLKLLTPGGNSLTHPLLNPNGSENIGVLVLSTDKGLAGALNTNIARATLNFMKSPRHPEPFGLAQGGLDSGSKIPKQVRNDSFSFYTIGRKGRQFIVKTGGNLEADFENQEVVTFSTARQIAKLLTQKFLNKDLGEIYIIYPDFISTLRQEPKVVKLLPVDASVISNVSERSQDLNLEISPRQSADRNDKKVSQDDIDQEFLLEPNAAELLDFVLTHAIETKIYQALLETKASEHSARMIAMQNATENAKELVEDLTLDYNQTRQEGITRELLEITTAQAALE